MNENFQKIPDDIKSSTKTIKILPSNNAVKKRIGERLKLVTFQSLGALKDLINKGYLECNEEYIDLRKAGVTYSWVLEKMDGKNRR